MKKVLVILAYFLVTISVVKAANVKLEWKEPEKYTDIVAGNTMSQSKFEKDLFLALEDEFKKQAARLDPSYRMEVTIFDIDLAGSVSLGQAVQIRKVNDDSFPRLNFYMFLYDKDNNIILQGAQRLKERKDKHNAFRMKGSQSSFYLERDLIEKWFKLAIIPELEK